MWLLYGFLRWHGNCVDCMISLIQFKHEIINPKQNMMIVSSRKIVACRTLDKRLPIRQVFWVKLFRCFRGYIWMNMYK